MGLGFNTLEVSIMIQKNRLAKRPASGRGEREREREREREGAREREREILAAACYPPALHLPVSFETYLSYAWGRYRQFFPSQRPVASPPPKQKQFSF